MVRQSSTANKKTRKIAREIIINQGNKRINKIGARHVRILNKLNHDIHKIRVKYVLADLFGRGCLSMAFLAPDASAPTYLAMTFLAPLVLIIPPFENY